jgi:hypothetical protein
MIEALNDLAELLSRRRVRNARWIHLLRQQRDGYAVEASRLRADNRQLRNQIACAVAGLENDLETNRDLADAKWRRTADERLDGEAFAYEESINLVGDWFRPLLDEEGD